ncbi:MAG: hypothetical protein JWO24_3361 [Rhodospirillales bacterium]|nr:hypothetical protein [Rhodospirillales bacterium]
MRQASHVQSRPRLHLNFAEVYRAGIAAMREAMAVDGGTEVMEAARALIDRLEVHPPAEAGGAARLSWSGICRRRCEPAVSMGEWEPGTAKAHPCWWVGFLCS